MLVWWLIFLGKKNYNNNGYYMRITLGFASAIAFFLLCLNTVQAQPAFQVSVAASPASVQAKQTEQMTATATANIAASDYNMVFTVTLNGAQVASDRADSLKFSADQSIKETFNWTVPSKAKLGAYTVTVAIKKNGDTYGSGTATFNVVSASPVNGACGSSNGADLTSAPTTNLCSAGTASAVGGAGPWNWTCAGSNGGTTASCSANLLVNGACGAANGVAVSSAPTANLCSAGLASTVSGSGPWNWTCAGLNGGTTASCSAPLKVAAVNGACGSSNGADLTSAPTTNLCSVGTASAVSGSGPWNWICAGSNGGTTASCSANLEINGSCGSANGVAVSSAPSSNLCTTGLASAVSGSGPWTWTCAGSNGGSTASCSAPLKTAAVNGACGSSNGADLTSAPTTNLCSVGTPSAVTGTGPWDWTCAGSGGGTTASCSAQLEINGTCGAANGVAVSSAPATGLCTAGTASAVSGSGPWTWTCAGSNGGTMASCSAPVSSSVVNGVCGSSNFLVTNQEPTANLCSAGTASALTGNEPWHWSCAGSDGGTTASCQTLVPAFYVATNGSDSNAGTLASPFATLGKCQTAMEGSSSIKTCYIRAGTYQPASPGGGCSSNNVMLNLSSPSDNGETYSYYPPDGVASAVLNGGASSASTGIDGICIGAANVTIDGLTLQNLQSMGITAWFSAGPVVIENNIIHDTYYQPFVAAIKNQSTPNVTVVHNYIYHVASNGISGHNCIGGYGNCNIPFTNFTVEYNVIQDYCYNDYDCGAVEGQDTDSPRTTGILYAYNWIEDGDLEGAGPPVNDGSGTGGGRAIYLDDGTSNATIKGNIVTGKNNLCGQIHGGTDNTWVNNICDMQPPAADQNVGNTGEYILYPQNDGLSNMSGNSYANSIIIASDPGGGFGYSGDGSAPTPVGISNNAYHNYAGGSSGSCYSGGIYYCGGNGGTDASPQSISNLFNACPSNGADSWSFLLNSNSPALSSPVSFPQPSNDRGIAWGQPGFWGPPGFVIPHTGTPPSYGPCN